MKLYSFFRSGTSHRLRIAVNLKGLPVQYVPVSLAEEEHLTASYKAINPQGRVPALELDDGTVLTQSPAIIEWLEERYPHPPLLPVEPLARAHVRALAALVGNDIHPINNRCVLQYLRKPLGHDEAAVQAWCVQWITAGFDALEAFLGADTARGDFCHGGKPGLADIYLIPQVESARRFGIGLGSWPCIQAVDAACASLEAFRLAAPAAQPDAF